MASAVTPSSSAKDDSYCSDLKRPLTGMLRKCNVCALESPCSPPQIRVIGSFRRKSGTRPVPRLCRTSAAAFPPLRAAALFRVAPPWFPLHHGGTFLGAGPSPRRRKRRRAGKRRKRGSGVRCCSSIRKPGVATCRSTESSRDCATADWTSRSSRSRLCRSLPATSPGCASRPTASSSVVVTAPFPPAPWP